LSKVSSPWHRPSSSYAFRGAGRVAVAVVQLALQPLRLARLFEAQLVLEGLYVFLELGYLVFEGFHVGRGSSRLIARRMGDRRPSAPAAWSGAHDQERPRRVLEPGRRQPPQQILDRLFGDPKIPADVHGREFFAVDAQADRVDVFAQRKASTTGPRRAAIRAPGKPSEISPRTKDASASSARWPRLRTRNGHPIRRRRRRRRRRLTTSWKPPALSGDTPKIGGGKPRRKGRNLTYSNTL